MTTDTPDKETHPIIPLLSDQLRQDPMAHTHSTHASSNIPHQSISIVYPPDPMTDPSPSTHSLDVKSASLNCSVLPKDEGDYSTNTRYISSSTTTFNKQYGQEGKGQSMNRKIHLIVMEIHPIQHSSHLRG